MALIARRTDMPGILTPAQPLRGPTRASIPRGCQYSIRPICPPVTTFISSQRLLTKALSLTSLTPILQTASIRAWTVSSRLSRRLRSF